MNVKKQKQLWVGSFHAQKCCPRLKLICSQILGFRRYKNVIYGCLQSIFFSVSRGYYGIKSYLFAAFLHPYNGWFVLPRLEVKPFIFAGFWRLKGPYISNYCIIAGQFFVPLRKLCTMSVIRWSEKKHCVFIGHNRNVFMRQV